MIETAAIFLAAGNGSRLNCIDVPKAMLMVHGRPIITDGLKAVIESGFTRESSAVVVGHLGNMLDKYCRGDFKIAIQDKQDGNAGALSLGLSLFANVRNILVVQGDDCLGLTNQDVGHLIRFHESHNYDFSLRLVDVPDPKIHRYSFTVDSDGRVVERTNVENRSYVSGHVMGVYCFKKNFLGQNLSLIKEINGEKGLTSLIPMAMDNKSLGAIISNKKWWGINTLETLMQARQK